MKKCFTYFLFMGLIISSFIITEKTSEIVLKNDELMITIKELAPNYKLEVVDGKVIDNTFIPGISGLEVNIKKSYRAMKKYGVFISSLLTFNEIKPSNRLENNYDKYIIGGNEEKKIISLIFLIHKENNIEDIIKILEEKNVFGNFFVDGYWFVENNKYIPLYINKGYVFGNLSYNGNYNDGAYIWMDTVIQRVGKQKNGFCYLEEENENFLKICALNKNYTIKPKLILKDNYYNKIKKSLENGLIISLDVNNSLINELGVIIDYIKSKGYKIENLNVLLSE